MLATARRYSDTLDDAEDAYQRAAEILLTNAPDRPADDMCRWLRTTVKHEAIAIRRQRERTVPMGAPELVPEPRGARMGTHERVERFERLQHGAQALGRLKPQEVRCLVLKAQGYTYNEICAETGFSYTKVDRCLKEGRSAFAARLAGIDAGDECGRVAPLLSALADGEATARSARRSPPPPAHLPRLPRAARGVPGGARPRRGAGAAGRVRGDRRRRRRSLVESAVAAVGDRGHQFAELAAGQKAAAVAASAAALAGGGAAVSVDGFAGRPVEAAAPAKAAPRAEASEPPAPPVVARLASSEPEPSGSPPPVPAPEPQAVKEEARPAQEFAPDAAAAPAPAAAPAASEFSPGGAAASGGGEFGP